MIKYISRHNKDYSRYNIIKSLLKEATSKNDIYILLPFSKNKFIKHFFKRNRIINDFFISNYDTYVHDRKKISKYNPRAWWKFFQDWFNFRFSKFLLSDTKKHFEYWESLFGKYHGKLLVLPVLADQQFYYPSMEKNVQNTPIEILFYGSFIPLHGIDVILKALKTLENNNVTFHATLIGNGQTYKEMLILFNKLQLTNVIMDGNLISEPQLADKIRECDIVLGIFGNSTKAKSVIPNKVYQALACKKPIITRESSTIDEFFSKDDIIQSKDTPANLAKSLTNLIQDNYLRKSTAINGYNTYIKLYNNTQKTLLKFIETIDQECK